MQHFLKDVMQGKPSKVSANDGLQANLIADAALKSLREGVVVRVLHPAHLGVHHVR